MRHPFSLLFTPVAVLLLTLCVAAKAPDVDPWDRVLAAVGLTRETCHFDSLDLSTWGGSDFLLPAFHAMHQDPLRIPFYVRTYRQRFLKAAASATPAADLVMAATDTIDEGTRRTLIGDPLAAPSKRAGEPGALEAGVRAVYLAAGKTLTASETAKLAAAAKGVPTEVARPAALLLLTEARALEWRNRALRRVKSADMEKLFGKLVGVNPDADTELRDELFDLMHTVEMKLLMVGGIDLALAADQASAALSKFTETDAFTFDFDTPLGRVALHGGGADSYPGDRPYLLIIDTGGDDTYFGGGATYDSAHSVSVLIDRAGNDRYLERADLAAATVDASPSRKQKSAHPTFGAGVLGYGLLLDMAGDDTYRALNNTQGRGLYGVGLLLDRSGSDRYDCYTVGQGAGSFGAGVLADLGGKDEYRCFTTSQGFGDTKGCGALLDAGDEDDVYLANDKVIDFPSPQDASHNASLAQGVGFGRRADYSDGRSLAGGMGFLVDGGGKNSYSAGLFAQGAGYWYGFGLLSAGSGTDTYHGVWYVQASAAHFAIGALHDTGGNDDYKCTHNMGQGAGHDFSIGFLLDDAGDDRHEAPNLSLGGANANGFGFFWDRAGNDTYIVPVSTTLGRASIEPSGKGSIRERNLTVGIFLDTGGADTYPASHPWAKNNTGWTMKESGPPELPVMRGVGLDVEAPTANDPR